MCFWSSRTVERERARESEWERLWDKRRGLLENHIAALDSHLLCLTCFRVHSETINNCSSVVLLLNGLIRLDDRLPHALFLFETGRMDHLRLPKDEFWQNVALLHTGGRTRLPLALMTRRAPRPPLFSQSWRSYRADVSEGERVFVFWSPEETRHISVSYDH